MEGVGAAGYRSAMVALPSVHEMYDALVARDASYEGVFIACVKTTGVFCRPTCTARKPKASNVEYVATPAGAVRRGYRACKVCRPLDEHPRWVTPLLTPSRRLTDDSLRSMGIEPSRARRYFKRKFGVTYHAYQRAWRVGNVDRNNGIAAAAYDAGFESESGFRDALGKLDVALLCQRIETPLGPMVAEASASGITRLDFREHFGVPGSNEHLEQLASELQEYFAGERQRFSVALDVRGTPFQQRVWKQLLEIPFGVTTNYGAVADAIGRPGASRAVGTANALNRIWIVIPCHRVVRADGSLSGYAGGVWRKRRLLELEHAVPQVPLSPAVTRASRSA